LACIEQPTQVFSDSPVNRCEWSDKPEFLLIALTGAEIRQNEEQQYQSNVAHQDRKSYLR